MDEQMSFFIISQSKTWKAADDWLELNPAEEGWELAEFHKERFASPGASLKGLNLHGCTWQTDNSTDGGLMERGLDKVWRVGLSSDPLQNLTICLEMQVWRGEGLLTRWVIPVGLIKVSSLL